MGDPSFLEIFASVSFSINSVATVGPISGGIRWGAVALSRKRIYQGSEELHMRRLLLALGSQLYDQRRVIVVDSGGTGSKIADGGLARCQGLVLCHCLQGGDLLLQSISILWHGVVFGSSGACLCRGALVEGVGTVVPAPL